MWSLVLLVGLAVVDGGGDGAHVRLQAAVVVASSDGRDVATLLQPLERRLRTLLPYTSYKGFTEYTASLSPGEQLDLRLPDGRAVQLTPHPARQLAMATDRGAAAPPTGALRRPIQVAVERGENFESTVACDKVTVFQIRNATADKTGDRTFLVYTEACPGEQPPRLMSDAP